MNHREKFLELYSKASSVQLSNLPSKYVQYLDKVINKSFEQKGVFTVLITLLVHKILNPKQDIRLHQESMKGGFSARTIDTKFITPTLKEVKFPSMAESGWLTRSLEQPFPYDLKYKGHIKDTQIKEAFLNIIDSFQRNPEQAEYFLLYILRQTKKIIETNKISIIRIKNPEKVTILNLIDCLSSQFFFDYKTSNGAKLPVLAFFAIYKSLLKELKRYTGCCLKSLGSHTTCDTTSKSAGDIEIQDNKGRLFEVLEIKLNRDIDITILRIVYEKIVKYNPKRYYILSTNPIKEADKHEIEKLVEEIRKNHGCQVIINGLLPTLKYYFRLVSSLETFVKNYSKLIEQDEELKLIHKQKWNEIINKLNESAD